MAAYVLFCHDTKWFRGKCLDGLQAVWFILVFRIRTRIGSGFNKTSRSVSGSGFGIRIWSLGRQKLPTTR
jgi:hypothetical protein